MCGKSADNAFETIVKRLRLADVLLAVTHANPDGDGLGSMAALAAAARAAGKTVHMLSPGELPRRYAFLFKDEKPAPPEQFAALAGRADVVVVLDTCAFSQLHPLEQPIRKYRDKIVVIDHHATIDDVGAAQWIDASAAAAGVMVAELLARLNWPLEPPAIEALATAVLSDTGWLRFANTDSKCLSALVGWLDAGLQLDKLYRKIYQSDRPARLRLLMRVLDSLELYCDGRLAVMSIRKIDFKQTGATPDETENLINEALRLESVEAAIMLVEQTAGVRASLRSRDAIDVAAIAQRFGGGGHARAAGLQSDSDIATVKQQLIAACTEALQKARLCN